MGDVKLNSTGGGSVTLTPPSTASNLTLTLPSASGTVATTSGSGSVFTNPTINGFTGDTSVINVGSGQFYKDTSGNVGIGTSSPSTKLDIQKAGGVVSRLYNTSDNSDTYFETRNSYGDVYFGVGGANAYIYTASSIPISFYTAGSERMRLDSSGNLGLGVTPSAWGVKAVQVAGNGVFSNFGAALDVSCNAYNDGSNWRYTTTSQASRHLQIFGEHRWLTAPSGTAGNAISFTQAMTLDASGNLLVGTTTIGSLENAYGVTLGPSSYSGVAAFNSKNGNTVVACNQTFDDTTSRGQIYFYRNETKVGDISSSSTATTYNSASDQRLKENIVDAPSAIDSVNSIKVRSFDWKSDGSHVDYGYIAQELLDVVPEAVSVPEDPEEMMGVDFGKLTPRLVKAIQELSAKNDALEARIAAMEAK